MPERSMRERKRLRVEPIACQQQAARQPLLDGVETIAGSCAYGFVEQSLRIAEKPAPEARQLVRVTRKLLRWHPE
jgi:hypothetical protein